MDKKKSFRAVIESAGAGGAYVTVPFNVEQVYEKKRVKVKAWIGGELYRGSLVRMGGESHILGVRKDIREKIGKSFGDEVEIVIEEDNDQRDVAIPADLLQALQNNLSAKSFFQSLAYTHQKAYVEWVEQAKRENTRQDRIARIIQMLNDKKKPR